MLQHVATCCSVLQRVAACSIVLRCVAVCCSESQCVAVSCNVWHFAQRGILYFVAVCCIVLQCVALCYSVLQRVAACCNVLQCPALGSKWRAKETYHSTKEPYEAGYFLQKKPFLSQKMYTSMFMRRSIGMYIFFFYVVSIYKHTQVRDSKVEMCLCE